VPVQEAVAAVSALAPSLALRRPAANA
jgi:hypothetical protein